MPGLNTNFTVFAGGLLNYLSTNAATAQANLANVPPCLLETVAVPSMHQIVFSYTGSGLTIPKLKIMEAAVRRFLLDMGAL